MAALGDVSQEVAILMPEGSLGLVIPSWPDVSQAIPEESSVVSTPTFPGFVSFG